MPAQDRHISTNKHFRGDQALWRQLHFWRCSSTNETVGSCGSFPFIPWLTLALGRGNAPRPPARLHQEQLVPHSHKHTAPSRGSWLWLWVQHGPEGVSEPPYQQLLFHFPSSQAHFLSLVHRDYSNSNQNREEKAPQNARGTKLYKGERSWAALRQDPFVKEIMVAKVLLCHKGK